jgi:hypothetical protein
VSGNKQGAELGLCCSPRNSSWAAHLVSILLSRHDFLDANSYFSYKMVFTCRPTTSSDDQIRKKKEIKQSIPAQMGKLVLISSLRGVIQYNSRMS